LSKKSDIIKKKISLAQSTFDKTTLYFIIFFLPQDPNHVFLEKSV